MNQTQRDRKNAAQLDRVLDATIARRRRHAESEVVNTSVRLEPPTPKQVADMRQRTRDVRMAQRASRERYAQASGRAKR